MDWLTGIQNAINYVEEHLTGEIDYNEAAREAACSGFYFQRIFGVLCGISLGDYIRSRRLTLAGSELRSSGAKVIDVAFKYGYESPESFARAFLKFHGVTPSEAKKDGVNLRSFSRISVKITLSGGNVMDYKIVEKEAFEILEKVEAQLADDAVSSESIPDFWTRSQNDGTVETLRASAADKSRVLGVCYSSASESAKTFDYAIAAVCGKDTPVPEGFRRTAVPARTWAVFPCKGAMPDAIQLKWHEICAEFFPTSGYQPTCELDIEVYPDGDMSDPDYDSEIWIPVVKK